ncbi:MAG: tyrosine-protein phosphatase [Lachnospiraceae bacterium]|jgi:protein-tyrosine phosphatase|nr:tyrosine-protein phosphatase [Lachnospiraceae bacterium]
MPQIVFEGIQNVRDLGGLPLAGGRQVKAGLLLRTGKLSDMTEKDREELCGRYHVTEIVDLRTRVECGQHPDQELAGAVYRWNPIFPEEAMGITREEAAEQDPLERKLIFLRSLKGRAKENLQKYYPMMVQNPYCIKQLKAFFELVCGHGEGAFLWHCTMGKDRTGVTAALLLHALGASRETILADYLATNEALSKMHEEQRRVIEKHTGDALLAEQAAIVDSVDESFLQAALTVLEQEYGGIDRFLEEQLGIGDKERLLLRERYTC